METSPQPSSIAGDDREERVLFRLLVLELEAELFPVESNDRLDMADNEEGGYRLDFRTGHDSSSLSFVAFPCDRRAGITAVCQENGTINQTRWCKILELCTEQDETSTTFPARCLCAISSSQPE